MHSQTFWASSGMVCCQSAPKSHAYIPREWYKFIFMPHHSLSTGQTSFVEGSVTVLFDYSERIPDDTEVLRPVLCEITMKNSQPHLWATRFEPRDTECAICSSTLGPPEHVRGTDARAYLLTKHSIFPVKAFVKRCSQCSARHSYRDWR